MHKAPQSVPPSGPLWCTTPGEFRWPGSTLITEYTLPYIHRGCALGQKATSRPQRCGVPVCPRGSSPVKRNAAAHRHCCARWYCSYGRRRRRSKTGKGTVRRRSPPTGKRHPVESEWAEVGGATTVGPRRPMMSGWTASAAAPSREYTRNCWTQTPAAPETCPAHARKTRTNRDVVSWPCWAKLPFLEQSLCYIRLCFWHHRYPGLQLSQD